MRDITQSLKSRRPPSRAFQPRLFRCSDPDDARALEALLAEDPGVEVFDAIASQLRDLVKTRHPDRKLAPAEIGALVEQLAPDGARDAYGVWVHYPWSRRLCHLLDKEEFVELRTNRNRYKLTPGEQAELSRRRVGVIGLSVGQSVAVTMTLERSFGEIRLADFDCIDLSNLNRIRCGVHSVDIPKVHVTAREIFEIDPFLEVKCFPAGLTDENMEEFFFGGGKLDLAIEECDALEMKIRVRHYARRHRVPVVMDTSDRGMIDVERFDLEPDRPILHGLAEGLDPDSLRGLSNEEKVPHVLKIIGASTMSVRLKASLVEVEQTISTWPQLAADVVHGGAAAAEVARRINLGWTARSGRYFVDLEALVGGALAPALPGSAPNAAGPGSPGDAAFRAQAIDASQEAPPSGEGARDLDLDLDPDPDTLQRILEAAVAAPSGGNCQPWAWVYHEKRLYLFHDRARSFSLTDYQGMGGLCALGAATENLVLAARRERIEALIRPFPAARYPDLVAQIAFREIGGEALEPRPEDALGLAIGARHTNRTPSARARLDRGDLEAIVAAVRSVPGADAQVLESDEALDEVGRLIGAGDRMRLIDEQLNRELMDEIRWTPEEASAKRDGIFIDTLELDPEGRAGIEICRDRAAMALVGGWGGGAALEKMAKKSIAAASAVVLITMPEARPIDYFLGGRAVERAWLTATLRNIAFYPQTAIAYFFARLLRGAGEGLQPAMIAALRALRARYERLFTVAPGAAEVLLLRLSIAGPPTTRALRRGVGEVLQIV